MRIEYPLELAARSLDGKVLVVYAAPWLCDEIVSGVRRVASVTIPRPASEPARDTRVIIAASLDDLARLTRPDGELAVEKARTVLIGDGNRDAEAQADLFIERAHAGWPLLLATTRGGLAERLVGCANARVYPAPNLAEIAFQISLLTPTSP